MYLSFTNFISNIWKIAAAASKDGAANVATTKS